VAELTAALTAVELDQVNTLHDVVHPVMERYHGREVLFDWMKLQVEEAVYNNTDVTPYPEYIKTLLRDGKLVLQESQEHTRAYLESYNRGLAHPPVQYYRKVQMKDNVNEILEGKQLAVFTNLIEVL
jgi:hypothetical protein